MIIHANCKINIGLDILRKRDDGYHELSTAMFPVKGLYDIVEVTANDEGPTRFINKGLKVDCPDEQNICLKAYRLMHKQFGIGPVTITLDKRTPFGAGLGGGSSDGTAVVMALNEIFSLGLSNQRLAELAAQLGSDTPFFVGNTPQLCEGRGEILTPINIDLDGLWIVIIKPDIHISTREAYAGVKPSVPATPLTERLARPIDEWQATIKNDFEPSIFASHPLLATLKQQLLDAGAIYAAMSGSGSAMFGLFEQQEAAEALAGQTPYIFKL